MLEAPYGPQPDGLLIGDAFDLQREIAFHLQATTVKGLKRTNGLSILQARPFHTDRHLSADSVEKVAPLSGLRQNLFIGRRGITQHDGTVIEWAGSTVLLVQP